MASAVVVLKHETSTLRQSHNVISIDFKFGVGDYVREVTSPDKDGSGPMSGRDARGCNIYLFIYLFINHLQQNIKKHTLASLKYMQLVDCKSGHYQF